MSSGRTVVIDMPLPPRECHQNRSGRRDGWREEAAARRGARQYARAAVVQAYHGQEIPRWERCAVGLHFRYPDKRRRDLFNFAGACKAYLDGMGDAGVYRDDAGIVWGTLSCEVDAANPGVTITVTEAV